MSRRRQAAGAIVASPVLVGAVTVLVAIVAVFIAYGANSGLPFVPTYDLKVQLPSGAKLVKGDEVRVGGFRVGAVEQIGATRVNTNRTRRPGDHRRGRPQAGQDGRAAGQGHLVHHPPALRARPEVRRGGPRQGKKTFAPGSTVRLGNGGVDSEPPIELEDVLSTFDAKTREAAKTGLEGFGSGLAGRGQSINEAIRELNPLLRSLTPVMCNLSDPDTELAGFFQGLGRAAGEVAPVASTNAALFGNMADTFPAITRSPEALQDSISKGVPTQIQAIRSFRFQLPFLRDFADLSRRLRPAARSCRARCRRSTARCWWGATCCPARWSSPTACAGPSTRSTIWARTPTPCSRSTTWTCSFAQASRASTTSRRTRPSATTRSTSSTRWAPTSHPDRRRHASARAAQVRQPRPAQQPDPRSASRPVDVEPGQNNKQPGPNPPATLHGNPDAPAIDANGNADCEVGQTGYVDRFFPNGRYGPNELGGRKVALGSDLPGLRGGTYKSRQLGIDNLNDVP